MTQPELLPEVTVNDPQLQAVFRHLVESEAGKLLSEVRTVQQTPPRMSGVFKRMSTALFGWDQRRPPSVQPDWKKYADDVVGNLEAQRLSPSWLSLPSDRIALYDLYDELDGYDFVSTILDAYAENATQVSAEQGRAVWVDSGSDKLKKALEFFFDEVALETLIEGMARDLAKYGDDFARLNYNTTGGKGQEKGVFNLSWMDPRTVERIEDAAGILVGFMPVEIAASLQLIADIDEEKIWQPHDFIHLRTMKTKYYRSVEMSSNEQYSGSNAMYGTSMLYNVRRVGKQLRFLEELLIIFRLGRAVDKHIYYIDVGDDADPIGIQGKLNWWKRRMWRKDYMNPNTGEFQAIYSPQGLNQDIWWPVRGNESNSRVEVRPGLGDISDIVDINYFMSKLTSGLAVPKEFLGMDGFGNYEPNKSLASQSVRFNRAVVRLQQALLDGVYRLCDIHLMMTGWKPEDFDGKYKLNMVAPSEIEDLNRLDVLQMRISNGNDMLDFLERIGGDEVEAKMYTLRSILGFRDAQIEELLGGKPEEVLRAAGGEDMDGDGFPPEPGDEGGEEAPVESKVSPAALKKVLSERKRLLSKDAGKDRGLLEHKTVRPHRGGPGLEDLTKETKEETKKRILGATTLARKSLLEDKNGDGD